MTFVSPAFLWALPLAAAPLVLHLLSRRRAKREAFSDLSLLRRVHARALPRTRLQQWLLVAARCLLLLLLILAYAGPVLQARGGAQAGAGETLDLAVLVDESYSMGAREAGKTRFDLARAQLESLLRTLPAADRVALIPFSDQLEVPAAELGWRSPRQVLEALPRLALTWRPTDYAPALRAAEELFARGDSKGRRAVLLLGDGARHGARGPLPSLPAGVTFLGLDWSAPPANAYLVSAGPSRESDARRPQLLVRAAGLTGPTSVELSADGRRLDGAALSGAGEQAVTLPLPAAAPNGPSEWSGQAALRPDALAADDAYYFAFQHPARPRVLCLYGNPAFFRAPNAGYFLKQLLGGEKESLLPFEADYLDLARLEEARLSDYRIVILVDAPSVPPAAQAALESFVRRGGGLLAVPGSKAGGEALAPLGSLLPAQIGPLVEGEGGGLRPGPAADARAWRGFELDKVQLLRYHLLQVRPGAQALFRSASGYPLLVAGRSGAGRAAVWAATFDATWTNLPLKPLFADFVQAALDAVSPPGQRGTQVRDLKVGQPIQRVWQESEAAPSTVRLRGPDGRSQTLWLRQRRVEFPGTERPGLYALTEEGSGRREMYAVNVDRGSGESDLAPLANPPWKALKADDLAPQFALSVYGRDARAAALAGAAALLILEMLLALPRQAAAALLFMLLAGAPARAQTAAARKDPGDRFVWTQLKLGEGWDPYPTAWSEALNLFGTVTSVLTYPERRVITPSDPDLYYSPLVILAGRQAPPELSEDDVRRLRNYLTAGGLLWIEDASGLSESSFDRWVRRALPRILPESELAPLPNDHVVYRTFFLLRGPAGRVMVRGSLEGVSWGDRTAVIYSRNDLLGVWPKDALGQPLYPCAPGGEAQRHNARKLTLNILMYALTGSYKADAVHQPYLLQKMREGVP